MNRDKDGTELLRYLVPIYFCPERKKSFPSFRMRRLAKKAMRFLLHENRLQIAAGEFSRSEIHDLLENQMMPEHLDRAIGIYLRMRGISAAQRLALLLIGCILADEPEANILYERDHSEGGCVL